VEKTVADSALDSSRPCTLPRVQSENPGTLFERSILERPWRMAGFVGCCGVGLWIDRSSWLRRSLFVDLAGYLLFLRWDRRYVPAQPGRYGLDAVCLCLLDS